MRKYPEVTTLMTPKIASHEPTAIKRDPSQDTDVEPVTTDTGNTKQTTTVDSGKSDESTPGVSATFSCEDKYFSNFLC